MTAATGERLAGRASEVRAEVGRGGSGGSIGSVLLLGLFLVAVGIGLAGALLSPTTAPARIDNPYPPLPAAAEPAAAATFVAALVANDVAAVAGSLPDEQLQRLGAFLEPVIRIDTARFLGAVERDGDTIAGYVINGTNAEGAELVVGLSLLVREGKVVAVQ
jgi:hypothetical protein